MAEERQSRCEECYNGRWIVSENGIHVGCVLSGRSAILCMTGQNDKFRKAIFKRTEVGEDG